MNYLPFSKLAAGELFRESDSDVVWMKSSEGTLATAMQSFWRHGTLIKRGYVSKMEPTLCVAPVPESEPLQLQAKSVDPVDPRRRFWAEGLQVRVGRGRQALVNVFAGLYTYSGFGSGTYYAAAMNEVFHCSVMEARNRADAEGLPFVYHDLEDWTSDPDLTNKRRDAKAAFEERRQRQDELTAFMPA